MPHPDPGLGYLVGILISAGFLVVAAAAEFGAKRFHPSLSSAAITATTLAGTTLTAFFDRSLGIGYLGGSLFLFAPVLGSLGLWYRSRGWSPSRPS